MKLLILGLFALYGVLFIIINLKFAKARKNNSDSRLIILTGGGTGGHVYPLLAIYEELKSRNTKYEFAYIGVQGKAEAQIIPRENITLYFTNSVGYPGVKNPIALAKFLFVVALGTVKCIGIIIKLKPECVISTGGYVSAPAIIATLCLKILFLLKIGIFIHEQNTVPGQLNQLFGRWANYVFVSFKETLSFFPKNGIFTGYPVRLRVFSSTDDAQLDLKSKIPENRKVVFVFGGSQGSRTINRALIDALPYLYPYRKKLFIIHGMGLAKSSVYNACADTFERLSQLDDEIRKELSSFYYAEEYFHNIGAIYKISDLIVARSGAGTLNEIAALGKPSILIPKGGLPGDHQVMNARALRQAGAAHIIYEDMGRSENGEIIEFVDGQVLARSIISILQDSNTLSTMSLAAKSFFKGDAAKRIVDCIESSEKAEQLRKSSSKINTYNTSIMLPSRGTVLSKLNRKYEESPDQYNPSQVFDPDDLDYYKYRATRLLYNKKWQVRNVGVKLCGYLLHRDKLSELLRMITDRTPVPLWLRIIGGDFIEVGFIRRNAIRSIIIMDVFNKDVEKTLEVAINDPYYEVRSEACRAVKHFSEYLAGKDKWLHKLLEKLEDPSFEVIYEAAIALGYIGIDSRALEPLLQLGFHHMWQIRHAALMGILKLLERHIIYPSNALINQVNKFVLTSTDFYPVFQLKETYKRLIEFCNSKS